MQAILGRKNHISQPSYNLLSQLLLPSRDRLTIVSAIGGFRYPAANKTASTSVVNTTKFFWAPKARTLQAPPKKETFTSSRATQAQQVSAAVKGLPSIRGLSGTSKMASDESYMDFLNKANQDPAAGRQDSRPAEAAAGQFRATEAGVETPAVLAKATKDAFYSSESDEPFVPVALRWDKGLPNEEEFARLIGHWDAAKAKVEIMDPAEWDTQGQYGELLEAVREAGRGNDVRVYRVQGKERSRVEYWMVTATGDKLAGVKALAIES